MRKLKLDDLKNGVGGLTEAFGIFLVEAAMYCLEANNHNGKAILKVEGAFSEEFELIWKDRLTDEVKNSWFDKKEATEYGVNSYCNIIATKIDGL